MCAVLLLNVKFSAPKMSSIIFGGFNISCSPHVPTLDRAGGGHGHLPLQFGAAGVGVPQHVPPRDAQRRVHRRDARQPEEAEGGDGEERVEEVRPLPRALADAPALRSGMPQSGGPGVFGGRPFRENHLRLNI